jgi:hypothetical protein
MEVVVFSLVGVVVYLCFRVIVGAREIEDIKNRLDRRDPTFAELDAELPYLRRNLDEEFTDGKRHKIGDKIDIRRPKNV